MTGIIAAAAGAAVAAGPALSVVASPAAVSGVWDGELGIGLTDPTTAVITGGVSPYTVQWAKVSGDTFSLVPNSAAVTVSFSFTGPASKSAVYRATVTDSASATASADVTVTAN